MNEQQIKDLEGLTASKAKQLQDKFGKNELVADNPSLQGQWDLILY